MRKLVLILASYLALSLHSPAHGEIAPSTKIKTAYLLNFAKFVRWPESDKDEPLYLCFVGNEEDSSYVEQSLNGRLVQGRTLFVETSQESIPLGNSCHIIYLSGKNTLPGTPALLVGDGIDFARNGGNLAFTQQGDHIRFVANLNSLKNKQLQLDAQLLSIAQEIIR